jgi:hypothetical protein
MPNVIQWLKDHHSAVLATLVVLQNSTPLGGFLHKILVVFSGIVEQLT